MATIDVLSEDDWARLAAIRLRALEQDQGAFGSSLAREQGFGEKHWRMRLRSSTWLVLGEPEQDAGVLCLIEEPGAPADERHVVSLWVDPDLRRRGHGQALLDTAAGRAAEVGAVRLTLWAIDSNKAATALYRRAGYVATGASMPLPRDPRLTEHRWEKRLGPADVSVPSSR
ncbi:GNAT family N-acetyltransferase [Actinotalea sp. C106]|uniref:GNAT family N-acetyltransferase n=1 Tax=Actinotalea sp. C106 TaxID=2908644 RepID=UPI0020284B72|nr:GNAT family N-acetyltransferase [Actinotalea sp. C106]